MLVQWGALIFGNLFLRFSLLVSSPLSSFTTLIDSLFCPSHRFKLYSINLMRYLCFVNIIAHSQVTVNTKPFAVKCCWILFCLWFTGCETVYLKCHFLECSGVSGQRLWPKMLYFKMFIWHLKNKLQSIPKFLQPYHFLWG